MYWPRYILNAHERGTKIELYTEKEKKNLAKNAMFLDT
jgi:hypothetical protein